jgi:hypothetical protein
MYWFLVNRFLMSGISFAFPVADEFMEYFSKHIRKIKMRRQPADMSTNLFDGPQGQSYLSKKHKGTMKSMRSQAKRTQRCSTPRARDLPGLKS